MVIWVFIIRHVQAAFRAQIWEQRSIIPTLLRSGGNLHHATFRNPTAAVNLFLVGKQYLTLLQAEAVVTRNLIGRKVISIVKRSDTRNALPTVAFVKVD